MKTWAVITQKGGSGKTTIALHLAIMAERSGVRTAVIDIDPQRSSVKWSRIRSDPTPYVIGSSVQDMHRVLADLQRRNIELAIIDTSPRADRDALAVSAIADLLIVPVRPSVLDLPAVEDTLRLIQASNRLSRTVIVLNAVPASTNEGREAGNILSKAAPVITAQLGDRVDYRRALTGGMGVTEFAPHSKAAKEIESLYEAIAKIAAI